MYLYLYNCLNKFKYDENKDFSVYVDSFLSFNDPDIHIQTKASLMLCFIMRSCNTFDNPLVLKSLYCALGRSILDYNSIIWSSCTSGPTHSTEAIQNGYLRLLSYKYTVVCYMPHTSYEP